MPAVKRIIGWLGGKALLYVALVLAILAGAFVAPWVERQWRSPARQLSVAEQIETGAVRPLTEARERTQQRLIDAAAEAGRKAWPISTRRFWRPTRRRPRRCGRAAAWEKGR